MVMPQPPAPSSSLPVIVVGAGLSGLCCALRLRQAGRPVTVLDQQDRVGGRVVTDEQDGFLLDRGFQVLLTSYPEVRAQLDLDALALASFRSGSAIQTNSGVRVIADPFREPWTAIKSLLSGTLSVKDALRSYALRRRLLSQHSATGSARDVLQASGISEELQASFFRPFFQGVTLAPDLAVPADYFAFLFRMFASGEATLPRDGMGAVPRQLAAGLEPGSVRLNTAVRTARSRHVILADGTRVDAAAVVVATEGAAAADLAGVSPPPGHRATTCVYFAVDGAPPFAPRLLLLNGTGSGETLHVCVPSVIQASYAPAGRHLVSATVLGDAREDVHERVRADLRSWFGEAVDSWQHLRNAAVPRALPVMGTEAGSVSRPGFERTQAGVVVCGDHLATPSIQGAMLAGRNAAEAVLQEIVAD